MAAEYPDIDASQVPELRRVADEVRRTRRAQTLHLADDADVVVVIKPRKGTASRKDKIHRGSGALSSLTLEEVFGAVPTPPHLRGKDIDEMIREAKDEHAEHVMRNS